jgi:RNase H-like domain found in reverse transcriptase/Integrase zinc binding domain
MYGQGPEWQTCRPAGFLSKKFSDAQRNYQTFEHETIAILEGLLKWEDKLIGRCIHVVTDHKALEFFQTQCRLSARQTRWMEYLLHFDFDIRYIKGKLNKVADTLSRYYQFDSWDDTPLAQHYIFADVRLDPNHEDLPWDRHIEIRDRVIENRSSAAQQKQVTEQLAALRERIEEQEMIAANMAATAGEADTAVPAGGIMGDDPTIYESQVEGPDLHAHMSERDPLNDDVLTGYAQDKLFQKVLEKPKEHPRFQVRDGFVWMKNRGGVDVLCVPSATSKDLTLHSRIIEQAHSIVGHFGPLKMSEYIRHWYWWPQLQYEVEKYCDSCEPCVRVKSEYRAPRGKLHSLPTPIRPWESIGMDFIGPFPESDGYDYLWVIICQLSSMVHLVPVTTTTMASQLSPIFVKEIVRLHGLPGSIVCDRDSKFTSRWWCEIHQILDVKILMSTSFHPQTDGITCTLLSPT